MVLLLNCKRVNMSSQDLIALTNSLEKFLHAYLEQWLRLWTICGRKGRSSNFQNTQLRNKVLFFHIFSSYLHKKLTLLALVLKSLPCRLWVERCRGAAHCPSLLAAVLTLFVLWYSNLATLFCSSFRKTLGKFQKP